jgi:DNA-3-methyladenine glycosylase
VKALGDLLAGDVVAAARALLGRRLSSEIGGEFCAVVLTEAEAYGGEDDPASHGCGGRRTANASMFGEAGTLYVYRSYGVHWCMNIVTGPAGEAAAVLLRAGRPVAGEEVMRRRRGRSDHLSDGPGKLAQALGVSGEHDGTSVFAGPVLLGAEIEAGGVVKAGRRVGISRAVERPWRFVLDEPDVRD